jgi:hypothetical protein
VRRRSWPTRRELSSEVFEYIEAFYNRVRRHSTLGMLSPVDYENATLSQSGAGLAASRLAHSPIKINISNPRNLNRVRRSGGTPECRSRR